MLFRRILIVDDDAAFRQQALKWLHAEGFEATAVDADRFGQLAPDFDLILFGADASSLAKVELEDARVIVFGEAPSRAPELLRKGAIDFLLKPIRLEDLTIALARAEERCRLQLECEALRQAQAQIDPTPRTDGEVLTELVGVSPTMARLQQTIRRVAEHKTTVLITGESGTGKELIARALHRCSSRKDGPFVAVNASAIPEGLIESELFGHKKGAFTDANRDKRGLFTEASGGTLFLDEIGELPLGLQVKLLRVLQEQVIRPVGSTVDEQVDVRVVAATLRNLEQDVKRGSFREDLFYRLNVLELHVSPLRERKDDIVTLADHFVQRTNARLGTRIQGISPEALKHLMAHDWPGNVRELENAIERSVVLCDGPRIEARDLQENLLPSTDSLGRLLRTAGATSATINEGELSIKKTTRAMEEELIRRALEHTHGNRTNAAKILEISHRSLLYKIKEYQIDGKVDPQKRGGTV